MPVNYWFLWILRLATRSLSIHKNILDELFPKDKISVKKEGSKYLIHHETNIFKKLQFKMKANLRVDTFMNQQIFENISRQTILAKDYYCHLVGINNGITCQTTDNEIKAIRKLDNNSILSTSEIEKELNFLCNFLNICSNLEFNAFEYFQQICDDYLRES